MFAQYIFIWLGRAVQLELLLQYQLPFEECLPQGDDLVMQGGVDAPPLQIVWVLATHSWLSGTL